MMWWNKKQEKKLTDIPDLSRYRDCHACGALVHVNKTSRVKLITFGTYLKMHEYGLWFCVKCKPEFDVEIISKDRVYQFKHVGDGELALIM